MIKRILVVSACIVALIGVFVLPASAAGIDYNELNPDIIVDGDNDIVSIDIPLEYYYMEIVDLSIPGAIIHTYGKDTFTAQLDANKTYDMYFGAFYASGKRLDLTNIPNDTIATVELSVYYDSSYTIGNSYLNWHYYDKSNNLLSISGRELGSTISGVHIVDSVINKPAGTDNGCLYFFFQSFKPSYSGEVNAQIGRIRLTMKISSLVRLQQQSGKTNEILTEVEKQLEANGQKLDNIINGEVGSTPPSGGGAVGDLDNAEGQIRDDVQSGLDQGLDVQQSALEILAQYWSAFACVSLIFNKFADLPFFSALLYMSFALGITGAILGLGLSLARAGDAEARRAAAEARRNRLGRGRKGG